MKFRRFIYKQLHQTPFEKGGLSLSNWLIFAAICLSVFLVIVETEKPFYYKHKNIFAFMDYSFGTFFAIEYALRIWSVGIRKKYRGFTGRLKYMVTPTALIDLLVIVPFFISSNSNIFVARGIRLIRILTLAKVSRYSQSVALVREAVWSRRHELILSATVTCIVLLLASTLMWVIEPDEEFSSIPRALWWGVVTLTTVGYGDVYPQTVLGKICSGVTALCGIGLIAMPAGILAGAFGEAIRKHKDTISPHRTGVEERLERVRRVRERKSNTRNAEPARSDSRDAEKGPRTSRAYQQTMRIQQETIKMRREVAKINRETARMRRDALKVQRQTIQLQKTAEQPRISAESAVGDGRGVTNGSAVVDVRGLVDGRAVFDNHAVGDVRAVGDGRGAGDGSAVGDGSATRIDWACERCGHDRFVPVLIPPSTEIAAPAQRFDVGKEDVLGLSDIEPHQSPRMPISFHID